MIGDGNSWIPKGAMNVMRKRMLVVLMCVLLVGSYPGWSVTGGIAHAAGDFAGGDGTAGNPFKIESADQLDKIRNYLDDHFILNQDIDMSAFDANHPWVPIGDGTTPFTGRLDGQNHTIRNMTIHAPSSAQPVGLFGIVEGGASLVQNLVIEAVEVRGLHHVGILAGKNSGAIRNVGVTGSVYGEDYVGGLVGMTSDSSQVLDSHSAGNVFGVNFVGGLTGAVANSHLSRNYAVGTVTGYNDVGGLSGQVKFGTIVYSYATGEVTGTIDVGGLVGKQDDTGVSYSYATGHVVGCEDVGGLIGDNGNSRTTDSYAAGPVTGSCAGGLGDTVGGLIGDNSDGEIRNSYAIGSVTSGSPIGGLVGYSNWKVTNSFYNRETTGQTDPSAQGLTSEEMRDRSRYVGWDFDTDWDMQAPHHSGYPYVKAAQAFVTYAGNGTDHSGESYSSQSYLPGSVVEVLDIHHGWTKTGYRFNGWNTADDGNGEPYHAHDTIVVNSNVLLYADWEELAAPALIAPADGQFLNNSRPVISGSADAGATVIIMLDGDAAATVTAAGEGSWSWVPTAELADGEHAARAGIADATGHPVNVSAEHTFTVDTVAPVITLIGDATVTLTAGTSFVEPGATVADAEDNVPVTITGSVDHEVPGTYTLQYDAADRAGNAAVSVTRTVRVVERSSDGGGGGGGYRLSDNANLVRLTVKADGDELTLTPQFAADTTRYHAETSAAEVVIEAIPSDSKAAVTIDDAALAGAKTVTLSEGDNGFAFKVKAESGVLKTYNLTIRRLTNPAEPKPEIPACTFRDIKGHWAQALICEALEIGIAEGHSETTFQPQAPITRVEYAAMLLRTLGIGSGPAEAELNFTDREQVPAWAAGVVGHAVENGVLQGYPDRTLRPNEPVNRSEMVAMMARAMKWETLSGDTAFVDDGDIPDWAKGYVIGAVQSNLVHGREGNRFRPTAPATRAEATAMLLRLWHMHHDKDNGSGE